jgi:hypothetical protein
LPSGFLELRGRRELVDQSHLQRLLGPNVAAGQHQVHRGDRTSKLNCSHRSAQARMYAELNFRES